MNTSPSNLLKSNVARLFIGLVALQLAFSGCAKFNKPFPYPYEGEAEIPADPNAPTYKVIMQGKSGKPEIYTGTITQSLTIEEALKESGAAKKHRHMMVDVARVVDNGQVLRLPVTYNGKSKTVVVEQNYAVLPGDEILVRPDGRGPLDMMMNNISGGQQKRSHLSSPR